MAQKSRETLIIEGEKISVHRKKTARVDSLGQAKEWQLKEILEEGYRLLKLRPRSEKEMRDKLTEKGFLASEIQELITRFLSEGWIDDSKFTKYFLESYQKSRPYGEYALKRKLQEKGIDRHLMEEELEQYYHENSPADEALNLVRKRFYQYQNLPKLEKIKKITAYLFNRGYEYPVIEQVTATLEKEGLI